MGVGECRHPYLSQSMKRISGIICVLFALACTRESAEVPCEVLSDGEANVIQGEVTVKFTEEMVALIEKGDSVDCGLDVISMERLFPADDKFEERERKAGLHRWYVVRYAEKLKATKAADFLSGLDGVEIAEARQKIKNTAYFNDPYLTRMWHLYDGNDPTASINVVPVWQSFTTGNPEIIVGVIDGGVQVDHPDLEGVVIPGGINGSRNFVDNGFVIHPHMHGTHVGGTIAAISNNGLGVSGIAGGNAKAGQQGVRLLSCQIFKTVDGGEQGGSAPAAIVWAANHGATIINNSWGYNFDANDDNQLTGDELTKALAAKISSSDKEAVDYFIANAGYDENGNQVGPMAGGVVFFAAGNEAIPNGAPANYEKVIAVGATDSNLRRASFSNYGDWVDIAAPGVDIYSTYIESGYASLQGTSMACPHVTGVAALLLSYYGGKGFTNEQLIDKLIGGANPNVLPAGAQIGPLLDAMGSFTYSTPEAPDAVSGAVSSGIGNSISLTFPVTGNTSGLPAYSYLMVVSKDRSQVENFDPFAAVPEGVKTSRTLVGSKTVGESITTTVRGLEFEQDYYCAVLAVSYQKRYSALSDVFSQATTENHAPVVTLEESGPFEVRASKELTIVADVVDPDGHSLTISFDGGSAAADYDYNSETGQLKIIIRGRRADAGTYTATITASDAYGLQEVFELVYTILENQPPVVVGSLDDILVYDKSKKITINVAGLFSDPEEEDITYKVRGNNVSLMKVDISGSVITLTPKVFGLSSLTIVAVDPGNKESTLPVKVLVKDPEIVAESFPNPVSDKLTIRTEEEALTHIRLTNSAGGVVFEKDMTVSGFNPAVLDMSSCAPGKYQLLIAYSDKSFTRTIIKK